MQNPNAGQNKQQLHYDLYGLAVAPLYKDSRHVIQQTNTCIVGCRGVLLK